MEKAYFSPRGAGSDTNTNPTVSVTGNPNVTFFLGCSSVRPILYTLVVASVLFRHSHEELVGDPNDEDLLPARRVGARTFRNTRHLLVDLHKSEEPRNVVASQLRGMNGDMGLAIY